MCYVSSCVFTCVCVFICVFFRLRVFIESHLIWFDNEECTNAPFLFSYTFFGCILIMSIIPIPCLYSKIKILSSNKKTSTIFHGHSFKNVYTIFTLEELYSFQNKTPHKFEFYNLLSLEATQNRK